jgi:hypothetical protein
MNKYAKLYFETLKSAADSPFASIFPSFQGVINLVKNHHKERQLAKGISSMPNVNLPKEVPTVDTASVIKGLPKPPAINFK